MGAFGAGIFDDDVALDVRASVEAALDNGLDMTEATARVIEEYGDYLEEGGGVLSERRAVLDALRVRLESASMD